MESTIATIVILVFTLSIFSTVGGNKNAIPSSGSSVSLSSSKESSTTLCTQVDLDSPGEDFSSCDPEERYKVRNFVINYGNNISEADADEISYNLFKYCKYYNLNPKVIAALIARESKFNKFAVSSTGAQGLGQLIPSTAQGLGVIDPFNIEQNIMGTTRYIRSLLDRFSGSDRLSYALASYLEGPNAVKNKGGFWTASKRYIEDIYTLCRKI
ncbi:hypothetical protein A2526_01450 [candidate division WOR-1 bacterium RIFOXYD2_FULL_36_8]|uniref:Transglycosylase SLT domain-containing protein n=1 Tax=candidate division WOR-1 bacterium RIFOXYB2_FULL_36_35 TaxID=1802578 RepID=A0A1F4S359_UNCSA|nr:MAG: hypothetical protein A2230_03550 [candidate division WOR-1 bacterium RIFOXYA2_FULL_36_21]OGC14173.1 MAG: hypothetical protein A2290_00660 [candidate division WOR-1 bacterium RIFOXYB2_FULL_36_35]OGC15395.1 MAG: hypothetical protein A2282_01650 [candidate division WOR-1 bacterium RIFOXYA12_FULL_36_13]OGC40698.1 MAG: hypothetical protein A2526_01450 [candidate division WOR-1 bacterium RIFOXYD2_FULL_36_8]